MTREDAASSGPRPRTSAWAPLRHPVFLALFIAQIASNIGSMMQNVGAAWLMGDLSASPTLVALVQTATLAAGLPPRPSRRRAGRHLRPPPSAHRQPDVDAHHRDAAGPPLPGRCRHAALAPDADLPDGCGLGPHDAGVAGHPARARAAGRVPPGRRPRRPHLQPRPGGRTGPRRRGRRARRAGLGLPDQRHLVPGRRGRAHLVAAAGVDLDVAGRDHDRRHAGRAALRPELDRAAPRAHPVRGVRRPGRRAARPAPRRRS